MQYSAVFNPTPKGGYEVSFPDFPGCVTFGKNLGEAKEKAKEVLELWLEEMRENNEDIPKRTKRPIVDDILVTHPRT